MEIWLSSLPSVSWVEEEHMCEKKDNHLHLFCKAPLCRTNRGRIEIKPLARARPSLFVWICTPSLNHQSFMCLELNQEL